MIRAFIAIPLPAEARTSLAGLQSALPAGRLVDSDQMHVTLAFLGEQREDLLEEVHLALEGIVAPRFELTIGGLGAFGKSPPRLLYAAVAPEPALTHLRKKIRTAVRQSGIDLSHERFVPHVTLARFNSGLTADERARLDGYIATRVGFRLPALEVTEFSLFRSTLGRNGAAYDELAAYTLT